MQREVLERWRLSDLSTGQETDALLIDFCDWEKPSVLITMDSIEKEALGVSVNYTYLSGKCVYLPGTAQSTFHTFIPLNLHNNSMRKM